MRRFGTILSIALLFVLYSSDAQVRTGRFGLQFQNGSIVSTFACYVPEDYDSTKSYQMLYGWHGAGMAGTSMRDMLYVIIAQDIDAIVVCPDANNVTTSTQLTALINTTLGFTSNEYNIDADETIITGFSWGGKMAYQIGMGNPTLFKGIIGLAPAIGLNDFSQAMWDNVGKMPMATILGDQDMNYAAVDAAMKEVQTRGGDLLYLVKPGVQHVDNTYFNSQDFIDDYRECYDHIMGITSISDVPVVAQPDISIYPSPVRDYVSISVDKTSDHGMEVDIITLDGSVVYSMGSSSGLINTNGWLNGIYLVRVTSGQHVFYKKMLKVK